MLNTSSQLRKPRAMEELHQHSWLLPIFFALGRLGLGKRVRLISKCLPHEENQFIPHESANGALERAF